MDLSCNSIGAEGARSLAAALDNNSTLTSLDLHDNEIGAEGARSLATALDNNATLTSLDLRRNNIGAEGARSLAAALRNNATLTSLELRGNNIGAEGARLLAAALDNNATLTSLDLAWNNIGAEGARSLAAALDNNATLTSLDLAGNNIGADIQNLVGDRLRVNKLVPKVALWVASAVARRVELWDDILVLPPALAARTAVLAFGDELLDLQLPDRNDLWLSPGGRDLAAAYLLPRAEATLRQELLQSRCSGWPTPPRERAKARAPPPPRATSDERLARALTARELAASSTRAVHPSQIALSFFWKV
jgi:hypothetical protein